MSYDPLLFFMNIKMDTTEVHQYKDYLDMIARKEAQVRQSVIQTGKMMVRVARATVGLLRSIASAIGYSLDVMSQAALNVIQNIIEVASAYFILQTALAVGTGGIAAFGLGMAALSLGVAIATAVHVAQGREEVLAQGRKWDAVLSAAESLARAPARWGTF